MAQLDAIGGSSEAGEYYSGSPPMILIVSSWSPPAMGKDEILYRALALLIGPDNKSGPIETEGSVMGVTRRAVLAGGVVAGVASGRTRRARAEAPVIKVGVLTDLSGPYRDINGPHDEPA